MNTWKTWSWVKVYGTRYYVLWRNHADASTSPIGRKGREEALGVVDDFGNIIFVVAA